MLFPVLLAVDCNGERDRCASSALDIVGSSTGYSKTKDYKISICNFSTKQTT